MRWLLLFVCGVLLVQGVGLRAADTEGVRRFRTGRAAGPLAAPTTAPATANDLAWRWRS